MTNKKLKQALLKKLDITPQALSQRVQKLKKHHAVTTEEATYVIAQQEGLILDRYLGMEAVRQIRELMQHISPAVQPAARGRASAQPKRADRSAKSAIPVPREIELADQMLSQERVSHARRMTSVYPLLYVLENSIREVIDEIMTSEYGSDWWDSQAPKGLREQVAKRMADETRHSWHQRRGARPIDYLDLDQLPAQMRKLQKQVVPNVIPSLEWFNALIEEVYRSRCVVCHMNPLDQDNLNALKVRFRQWHKQMRSSKRRTPAPS